MPLCLHKVHLWGFGRNELKEKNTCSLENLGLGKKLRKAMIHDLAR